MFPKRTGMLCCSEWEEKWIELSDLAKLGFDAAATCHAAKARYVLWVVSCAKHLPPPAPPPQIGCA